MQTENANQRRDEFFSTDHLKSELKRRSVRGVAIMFAIQAGRFLLRLSSIYVLARCLTPEDFGFIAMATVVTGFVMLFKDMGLSMATVQRAEVNHAQVSSLFWINIGIVLVLALLTAAIAPAVERFYGKPGLTTVTIVLGSMIIPAGLILQHEALLQRQMRYLSLGLIDLISMSVGIAVGITCALLDAGYWAIVYMTGATAAARTVLVWAVCSWRPGPPAWASSIRPMLAFGGNLTRFNLINYFSRNADNALIGWYWGAGSLGLYSKAYSLLLFPMELILSPLDRVAVPLLSRLQDDPERYRRTYLRVLEKLLLVTVPLAVVLFVTSDWVIEVVLGPQWTGAAEIFSWLSIAAVTQPVCKTAGWLFMTQDRTDELFRVGFIGGLVILASFLFGLPWGPTGVAASYSISGVVLLVPLLFWYVGRRGPVRARHIYASLPLPLLVGSAVAGASMLSRWWLDPQNAWIGLASTSFAAAVAMGLTLVSLRAGRDAMSDLRNLITTGLGRRA